MYNLICFCSEATVALKLTASTDDQDTAAGEQSGILFYIYIYIYTHYQINVSYFIKPEVCCSTVG